MDATTTVTKPPRITNLADLAALAGVSVGTVSRAISGSGSISAATRQRIRDLADEHGFRINRTAQSLKLGRTAAVGVVIPLGHDSAQTISDPFFITLVGYLADELSARGTDLVLSKLVPDGPGWLSAIVRSGRVDGVIVIGQSNQQAELEAVGGSYAPLLVWGQHDPANAHYTTVGSDNRAGGYAATRHLIDRGRRAIGFIGLPDIPEIVARRDGYAAALEEAGLTPGPYINAPLTAEAAHDAVADALRRGIVCDALVAASDVVAMSAMRALSEIGLTVPGDVAVTGYDDVILAGYTTPPLTTVRQDLATAARLLVDGVFSRLAGDDIASMVLPPELVVRGSS